MVFVYFLKFHFNNNLLRITIENVRNSNYATAKNHEDVRKNGFGKKNSNWNGFKYNRVAKDGTRKAYKHNIRFCLANDEWHGAISDLFISIRCYIVNSNKIVCRSVIRFFSHAGNNWSSLDAKDFRFIFFEFIYFSEYLRLEKKPPLKNKKNSIIMIFPFLLV